VILLSQTKDQDDPAFTGHKACPKCGSKDNNYRYPDGHEFCFGRCGYFTKAPATKESVCALMQERKDKEKPILANTITKWPDDAGKVEGKGLTWLKKYGMLDYEIKINSILWSQSQEQLIFPIYEDEHSCDCIGWQARNFRPHSKKYFTVGSMDKILHILGLTRHTNTDIIIVEDIVSAIKVSRHFRAMPLFGSGLSKDKLTRISRYTNHVRFWLDSDKLGQSMLLSKLASQLGMKSSVIFTEQDPKEKSDTDIKQLCR